MNLINIHGYIYHSQFNSLINLTPLLLQVVFIHDKQNNMHLIKTELNMKLKPNCYEENIVLITNIIILSAIYIYFIFFIFFGIKLLQSTIIL